MGVSNFSGDASVSTMFVSSLVSLTLFPLPCLVRAKASQPRTGTQASVHPEGPGWGICPQAQTLRHSKSFPPPCLQGLCLSMFAKPHCLCLPQAAVSFSSPSFQESWGSLNLPLLCNVLKHPAFCSIGTLPALEKAWHF